MYSLHNGHMIMFCLGEPASIPVKKSSPVALTPGAENIRPTLELFFCSMENTPGQTLKIW